MQAIILAAGKSTRTGLYANRHKPGQHTDGPRKTNSTWPSSTVSGHIVPAIWTTTVMILKTTGTGPADMIATGIISVMAITTGIDRIDMAGTTRITWHLFMFTIIRSVTGYGYYPGPISISW